MRIGFVGSGNVATHLAKALEKSGHTVTEIYSRTAAHAHKLSDKLYEAIVLSKPDFSSTKAEVIFICISDDAIAQVVKNMRVRPNQVVVHTSGASFLDVLSSLPCAQGVFYPVQTFTKSKAVDFRKIPICIEANAPKTEVLLEKLAHTICDHVAILNGVDRQRLHIGAVIACNFTNHLLALSKQWLSSHGLPFEIIHPLIQETFQKALQSDPVSAQTGPAIRKDQVTILRHIDMLQSSPHLKKIYEVLTDSIQTAKPKSK